MVIGATSSMVDYVAFYDRKGDLICEIGGAKRVGREHTLELKED